MKTRRGPIFNGLALLSAMLLLAAAVAWAHTRRLAVAYDAVDHWVVDADDDTAHSSRFLLLSTGGALTLFHARFDTNQAQYVRHFRTALETEAAGGPAFARGRHFGYPRGRAAIPGATRATWGFALNRWTNDNPTAGRTRYTVAAVPYWALALGLAVLPAWWSGRCWAASRRRPPGLCRNCGYDLRASPDRCPECGQAVTPASAVP